MSRWGQSSPDFKIRGDTEEQGVHMIRKFLMIGAATAMPLGFLAATGGIAGAKTLPINVSTDHVTCTTVTGSAKFSPALQESGPFSAETTSIKLALAGCTISGPVATTGI